MKHTTLDELTLSSCSKGLWCCVCLHGILPMCHRGFLRTEGPTTMGRLGSSGIRSSRVRPERRTLGCPQVAWHCWLARKLFSWPLIVGCIIVAVHPASYPHLSACLVGGWSSCLWLSTTVFLFLFFASWLTGVVGHSLRRAVAAGTVPACHRFVAAPVVASAVSIVADSVAPGIAYLLLYLWLPLLIDGL